MGDASKTVNEHTENFLTLAIQPSVVTRAVKIALIVGIVLAAINHGDKLMAGTLSTGLIVKILLTFFVPYSVSTYSSVLAIRDKSQFLSPQLTHARQ